MLRLSADNVRVLVDGDYRAYLKTLAQEDPYLLAVTEKIEEPYREADTPALRAKNRTAIRLFEEYLEKNPNGYCHIPAALYAAVRQFRSRKSSNP
jgi:hypothetical protein